MSHRVGVVGVTGYTGIELLRLIHGHPELNLAAVAAGRSAGRTVSESWPAMEAFGDIGDLPIQAYDPMQLAQSCNVVFLALPHGISAETAPKLVDNGVIVVDLGADFRLKDAAVYERFYGQAHASPERIDEAVYGLVELNRSALAGATLIANPGCYPTAVSLAAWPLVNCGIAGDWLVADCLSGVSGAGRTPSSRNLFGEVAEQAGPYGLGGTHRHVPEIEQTLGVTVSFTPHLVPMIRGMVATVTIRPQKMLTSDQLHALYQEVYGDEPMITVRRSAPSTADVRGTNQAHIYPVLDEERGVVTVISVIDNLLKGASGQAVQCLNVALGLDESMGLPRFPLLP